MSAASALPLAAAVCLVLAGCGAIDPFARPGTGEVSGSTQANLAAMVADPYDLVHGRSAQGSDGLMAAAAVERLREDRLKPIAGSDETSGSGAAASASAGTSAGAAPVATP